MGWWQTMGVHSDAVQLYNEHLGNTQSFSIWSLLPKVWLQCVQIVVMRKSALYIPTDRCTYACLLCPADREGGGDASRVSTNFWV